MHEACSITRLCGLLLSRKGEKIGVTEILNISKIFGTTLFQKRKMKFFKWILFVSQNYITSVWQCYISAM